VLTGLAQAIEKGWHIITQTSWLGENYLFKAKRLIEQKAAS